MASGTKSPGKMRKQSLSLISVDRIQACSLFVYYKSAGQLRCIGFSSSRSWRRRLYLYRRTHGLLRMAPAKSWSSAPGRDRGSDASLTAVAIRSLLQTGFHTLFFSPNFWLPRTFAAMQNRSTRYRFLSSYGQNHQTLLFSHPLLRFTPSEHHLREFCSTISLVA